MQVRAFRHFVQKGDKLGFIFLGAFKVLSNLLAGVFFDGAAGANDSGRKEKNA